MAKRDIRCEACGTLNRVPSYSFRRVPNCGKCGATLPEWWATRALRKLYVFRFPITLVAFAGVLVWALWLTFGGNILAVKKTSAPPRPVPQQIACTPTEPITIHGIYRVYDTHDQPRLTQWTISAGGGSNYFVKLFDATNGEPKVSYFAYGGSMLITDAPVGVFIVKYASGEVWCGEIMLVALGASRSRPWPPARQST
jgi:hypothetical protein